MTKVNCVMKMFNIVHNNVHLECVLSLHEYMNGNTAVKLLARNEDGYLEPYATISTNTGVLLPPGSFAAKMYSENEGLVEQLIAAGIVKDTGEYIAGDGYTNFPVMRLVK